jgi:ubiquinone/menaquinone biosynthesis C-methylase UbiE
MENQQKFIPALGYNWLSNFYDITIKLTMPEKKFRNKLLHELNPQPKEQILEFGFGTAQNIILLTKLYPHVNITGVDIDPKIKTIAETKIGKLGISASLFLYDGEKFPFPDNHFDKVFSCLVFHQLENETKLKCLQELHRVLKPNGELLIADWGKAKNLLMRTTFYFVQLLDGFKTTAENVRGNLPKYIERAGFLNAKETSYINTLIGSFSYYKSNK